MSGLVDATGRPISTARFVPGASRDAGAFRDPISGWRGPQVSSHEAAARERAVMQRRAGDLASNDWAAGSALDAISMNSVGTGLLPKAAIPAEMLGLDPKVASQIGKSMEWAWGRWVLEADVRGICHFHDLQLLGLRSMLSQGELLHLTVMFDEQDRHALGRLFSLAVQAVRPQRMQTPADLAVDPAVQDGVRLAPYGRPEGYYVANPKAGILDAFCRVRVRPASFLFRNGWLGRCCPAYAKRAAMLCPPAALEQPCRKKRASLTCPICQIMLDLRPGMRQLLWRDHCRVRLRGTGKGIGRPRRIKILYH